MHSPTSLLAGRRRGRRAAQVCVPHLPLDIHPDRAAAARASRAVCKAASGGTCHGVQWHAEARTCGAVGGRPAGTPCRHVHRVRRTPLRADVRRLRRDADDDAHRAAEAPQRVCRQTGRCRVPSVKIKRHAFPCTFAARLRRARHRSAVVRRTHGRSEARAPLRPELGRHGIAARIASPPTAHRMCRAGLSAS